MHRPVHLKPSIKDWLIINAETKEDLSSSGTIFKGLVAFTTWYLLSVSRYYPLTDVLSVMWKKKKNRKISNLEPDKNETGQKKKT